MPNLAPTSFQTGAEDTLVAVDVYNQLGKATLNSIQSTTGAIRSTEMSLLGRKQITPNAFPGMNNRILSIKNNKLSLNFPAVIRTLINSNPQLLAIYRGLSADYQLTLANVKAIDNLIIASVNQVKHIITAMEFGDVTGLANMAMALAEGSPDMPEFLFKDMGCLTFLATKIVIEAAGIGLTGIYKPLSTSTAFRGAPMRQLTRDLCGPVIRLGDHSLLHEIAHNGGGPYILQSNPGFISDYLAQYKGQYATQSECWKATGQYRDQEWYTLEEAFNAIDPNWQETLRQNGYGAIVDLSHVVNASDPFFDALVLAMYENAPSLDGVLSQEMSGAQLRRINTGIGLNNAYYLSLMRYLPRHDPLTSLKREFPKNIRL